MVAFVFLTVSCNDEAKTSSAVNNDTANNMQSSITDTISSGCYSQLDNRDTSLLQIQGTKGSVTGTLSYNIFQKDRNDGSFMGEMSNDILSGWYLFKSEGIMSVRQVAWKRKGNELWQGIGEMSEKSDTMRFVNPGALTFDSTRPFRKVECVL